MVLHEEEPWHSPIPWTAWLYVVGSFFLFFNSWYAMVDSHQGDCQQLWYIPGILQGAFFIESVVV